MKRPVATSSESAFYFHEFFFSKTNLRGVIKSGNDVFARVSVYSKEQMIGSPHSLIRHPDMPRAVFKIFWDVLKSNQAIGAYVKNLAGDGSYYWVFAFAFPVEDGYLSIRFKPSSSIFNEVQKIYAEVLEAEKTDVELEQAEELLQEKIKEIGYKSYHEFMVKAALEELRCREEQSSADGNKKSISQSELCQAISRETEQAIDQLKSILNRINEFQDSNRIFSEIATLLEDEFFKLKFISKNMTISAAKFGNIAAGLGVVAKEFSELSDQIEVQLQGLKNFVIDLGEVIDQCTFRISALYTQMLMVDFFVNESIEKLTSSENAFEEMLDQKNDFCRLYENYSKHLSSEIEVVEKKAQELSSAMADVGKFTIGLEVIRQIGAVESARVDEVKLTFSHYLSDMDKFIQRLRVSMLDVRREISSVRDSTKFISSYAASRVSPVQKVFDLAENSFSASLKKVG